MYRNFGVTDLVKLQTLGPVFALTDTNGHSNHPLHLILNSLCCNSITLNLATLPKLMIT